MKRWGTLGAALALPLLLSACGRSKSGPIVVLALDGLDPRTVDLLMSEGHLPSFVRLRRDGAYGRLQSRKPLLSPVVWTTIATGKPPEAHGIGHFVAIDDRTGEALPVTSQMRRVKAVWDIFSDQKKRVGVVGWWATWPAPKVNGVVVSDHTCYHFLFPQGATGTKEPSGLTYPPELFARISPLVRRPADVTPQEAAPFVKVSAEEWGRTFAFSDDVSHFRWALATADSYRRIGLQVLKEERPDLLLVYTEGTDSVAHLFGHLFRAQGLSGELLAQQQRFGQAVEQMYLYADRLVGEYLEALGAEGTLVVLSDHGFELGAPQSDPSKTRDLRRVSEQFHRIEGVLYLWGRNVKRGRIEQPTILDVAPTLLALAGIPPARDMPGRVLSEVLAHPVPGPAVVSYEAGGTVPAPAARDAAADPEILERLRSLGYIGEARGPSEAKGSSSGLSPPGASPGLRSPQGERNLAALHFEAGRHAEAAAMYERLLKENPKDAALHTSLAGCLGALGRFDEAAKHLEAAIRLEPLNVEAYHNRAVIFEHQGKPEAAIEQYRTALRYRPDYEPSRRALVRLTGSAEVRAPESDAERRAAALAEAAALTAKRGDYAAAMKQLQEAERIAPRYTVVYQYQSNVAYLMGDRAAAIRALEKGLSIEPDNALFKTNLKRLREAPPKKP